MVLCVSRLYLTHFFIVERPRMTCDNMCVCFLLCPDVIKGLYKDKSVTIQTLKDKREHNAFLKEAKYWR